jgi:hypothetical protein
MDDVYSAGATALEPKLGSGARVTCGRMARSVRMLSYPCS